jgi:hypothetical protein
MGVTVNHWLAEFESQMRSQYNLLSRLDNRQKLSIIENIAGVSSMDRTVAF